MARFDRDPESVMIPLTSDGDLADPPHVESAPTMPTKSSVGQLHSSTFSATPFMEGQIPPFLYLQSGGPNPLPGAPQTSRDDYADNFLVRFCWLSFLVLHPFHWMRDVLRQRESATRKHYEANGKRSVHVCDAL